MGPLKWSHIYIRWDMSEKYKLEIWEFSLSYDFLKISGPFPATITIRKYCSSQLINRNSKNVHWSLALKPRLSSGLPTAGRPPPQQTSNRPASSLFLKSGHVPTSTTTDVQILFFLGIGHVQFPLQQVWKFTFSEMGRDPCLSHRSRNSLFTESK